MKQFMDLLLGLFCSCARENLAPFPHADMSAELLTSLQEKMNPLLIFLFMNTNFVYHFRATTASRRLPFLASSLWSIQ